MLSDDAVHYICWTAGILGFLALVVVDNMWCNHCRTRARK